MGLNRYLLDPLYGFIEPPAEFWEVIVAPELQRLREVRLCNVNSLTLLGAGSVTRFEHAVGTMYLALRCLNNWPLLSSSPDATERRRLWLAALLHDVISGPFGHSLEYVESSHGFDHEGSFMDVLGHEDASDYAYRATLHQGVFFGAPDRLLGLLPAGDLPAIAELVRGEGSLGPLLASKMDLDNIDNVYRMALHMGVCADSDVPLQLAESLWLNGDGELSISSDGLPLASHWLGVRHRVYDLLLLNPEEFSAKCMLNEAIELGIEGVPESLRWRLVDFELLQRLADQGAEAREVVRRLATGDLYGCLGIAVTKDAAMARRLSEPGERRRIEACAQSAARACGHAYESMLIGLHLIMDVDKTDRALRLMVEGQEEALLGHSSKRAYVGVLLKNKWARSASLARAQNDARLLRAVGAALEAELCINDLSWLPLYGERRAGS